MTRPIIPTHMLNRPIGPDGLPYDPADGFPRVFWRDPKRCAGRPCFYGRRIWPECVTGRHNNGRGEPMDEIIRDFRLNPEHVAAALRVFRPILFQAPLVPPIIAGTKTATRRTNVTDAYVDAHKPGTVLWVREAFNETCGEVMHRADVDAEIDRQNKWTPGVHMPARLCRLWLTVTGCRVERLGDIDDAGARAEGFENRKAFIEAFAEINRIEWIDHAADTPVTVIEFTASTTPPLGWGDYIDEIAIEKAKREPTP